MQEKDKNFMLLLKSIEKEMSKKELVKLSVQANQLCNFFREEIAKWAEKERDLNNSKGYYNDFNCHEAHLEYVLTGYLCEDPVSFVQNWIHPTNLIQDVENLSSRDFILLYKVREIILPEFEKIEKEVLEANKKHCEFIKNETIQDKNIVFDNCEYAYFNERLNIVTDGFETEEELRANKENLNFDFPNLNRMAKKYRELKELEDLESREGISH